MHYVWDNRKTITLQSLKNSVPYHELLSEYPNMEVLFDQSMATYLLSDVKHYKIPEFECNGLDIGYFLAHTGSISYTTTYGNRTYFAYLSCLEDKRITKKSEQFKDLGLSISCGYIPYADLPNYFGTKLGLTGTYEACSSYEKQILKAEYAFNQCFTIPSLFVEKKSLNDRGVLICGGKRQQTFYDTIRDQIKECVECGSPRACLIFFSNDAAVMEYNLFLKSKPLRSAVPHLLLGEDADDIRDEKIVQACSRGRVTLISRTYGRGSDFVCRDDETIANGGVHVVQTFPCELKAEEVQIRGRTCRQDNPGSYVQILFLDDLVEFGITDRRDENQSWSEKERTQRWKHIIDTKREEVLLKDRFDILQKKIKYTQGRYDATKAFIEAASTEQYNAAVRHLTELQL